MATPSSIRAQMLQRAALLINGTRNEEAWHLIGLFQRTQPVAFLNICHRIMAAYLELTHDYFDQGWPLTSRLTRYAGSTRERRRARSKPILDHTRGTSQKNNTESDEKRIKLANGSIAHPLYDAGSATLTYLPGNRSVQSPLTPSSNTTLTPTSTTPSRHTLSKLKSIASKSLFKQILPSRPRTPSSTNKLLCFEHFAHTKLSTDRHHCPTCECSLTRSSNSARSPLNSLEFNLSEGCSGYCYGEYTLNDPLWAWPALMSNSCNADSMICRCLIAYMRGTPDICSTEGLFRIPGNCQRIRELWLNLRGVFQTAYFSFPQPEPDGIASESFPQQILLEVSSLLSTYSPHDLATLLLRCLTACSHTTGSTRNNSTTYGGNTTDEYCGVETHGGCLIPPAAGALCFLATRLQYALMDEQNRPTEDWMHILCHSRQLLTYRIVLQLLLPSPERIILLELLQLFRCVDDMNGSSRMPAECLARCTAVAVFGAPSVARRSPDHLSSTHRPDVNPLRWRIDTLTNLIKMVDQLDELPAVVYGAVRDRLRSCLGHSPVPRSTAFTQAPIRSASSCHTRAGGVQHECDLLDFTNPQLSGDRHQLRLAYKTVSTVGSPRSSSIPVWADDTEENKASSTLDRHVPVKSSLHRARSSADTPRSKPHQDVDVNSEPFKLWRRQKVTVNQKQCSASGQQGPITKIRSASVLSHQHSSNS